MGLGGDGDGERGRVRGGDLCYQTIVLVSSYFIFIFLCKIECLAREREDC